ncbi:hypothetical protein [Aliiruegeria lutimaris]|uniref:hypothetical protein n=1 Tax=Aliiruegeria lutimaris TaxID=571298 RepID=UPI001113AC6E|nr:hypothetical protein [Aliiruegeria lutimaris]
MKPLLLAAATLSIWATISAAQTPVNLLDPATAGFDNSLVSADRAAQLPQLLDGDPATFARFEIDPNDPVPVDLVFSFTGEGVAPETLVVTNSDPANGDRPARFDLLYSTVSATTGFRSIRDEALDALKPSETFKLPTAGANWVMLRLYPTTEATSLTLADIALSGQASAPETRYKFGESPVKALDIIAELAAFGGADFSLTDDEREVFAKASDNSLDQRDFENIALIASGVRDSAQRDALISQLDDLEAEARKSLDVSAPPKDLGEALLLWLHETVLTEGYVERQTNLSGVLLDKNFNCVSSATIYNALGQRLGLDLRAIEVPDHAFSILYDGADHFDIETTTPRGFNPHRERIEEFEKLTGFAYIPQSNKSKRREIERAGLAALIYYNHGVGYLEDANYYEALLANFRALSLDPEFTSAATNALAAMGRWSRDLAKSDQWEDAARVAALGRKLAPEDRALSGAEMWIWQDYALAVSEAEGPEAGLAVLERGADTVPDADFDPLRSALFIRPGEAAIESGDWDAAYSFAETGLALLGNEAHDDLNSWKEQLYLRQSQQALKNAQFDDAARVLFDGRTAYPDSTSIPRAQAYLAQTWSDDAENFDAGLKVLADFAEKYAPVSGLDGIAERFVLEHIREASQSGAATEAALDMAERAGALLASVGTEMEMAPRVYRIYGDKLIDESDWPAAAQLYSEGLERFAEDYYLNQNARYVAQQWQRAALESGGNSELEAVVGKLRLLFPTFAQNKGFGEKELEREVLNLVKARDYPGALAYLNGAQLLLSEETYRELRLYIIDHEANAAMKAMDWRRAAQIYATGRAQMAEPRIFSNNVAYIAQEWTTSEGKAAGAQGVAETMEALVALFPGDESVAEMGARTLTRLVSQMVREDQLDEAKAQVVLAREFLDPKELRSLTIVLYRDYGNHLISQHDWAGALAALKTGLEIVPDSSDLKGNVPYAFQEWAREVLATGKAEDFVAAVQDMKEVFPGSRSMPGVLENVLSQKAGQEVQQGHAEDALSFVNAVSDELDADTLHNIKIYLYDQWARQSFETDWAKAAEIYALGLEDVGKSSLLSNNLGYAKSKLE